MTTSYMNLYRKLRSDITSGIYSYGTKLPGKRIISDRSGFSLSTVEHALELLEEEGYLDARERSGFFVSYRQNDLTVYEEEALPAVQNTVSSSHDSEAFPSSAMAKAMRRILTDYPDEILKKTEGKGLPSLRSALSGYLARSRGIHASSEQIVIGSGTEYMYSLIIQLLGRDLTYGVESPSYDKIARIYRANGVKMDYLKMGKHGILTSELNRTAADVLHVTPYHSYPSGITADAAKRRQYIDWAEKRNGIIIEDDYDSEYTVSSKPEDTLFAMEPDHTVIYLNTFARTISPGIRVSYMILPAKWIQLYDEKLSYCASTVSTLVQMLLGEVISSGEFERHINRIRRKRRKEMHDQSTGYIQ